MRIVIVGAGIIGAAVAHALRGRDVTVLAAGPGPATAASFGWINASFFHDDDHFRLRAAALEAWRQLDLDLPAPQGCLWWEEQGEGLDRMAARLRALGYGVADLDRAQVARLEPALANPPERALRFAAEYAVDAAAVVERLLAVSEARLIAGCRVEAIETRDGRVTALRLAEGRVAADAVIVAAGMGAPGLLDTVGVPLPMRDAPGMTVRFRPVARVLGHVLATPDQEVRQDAAGRLWAPAAASHQGDDGSGLEAGPVACAEAATTRVKALLRGVDPVWDRALRADRPMPADGLPAIGAAGPEGLHVAVMHSGVTLAPLVGELLARQVTGQGLGNAEAALVAPYDPGRFSGAA